MTKSNLKDLVKQIEKYAKAPPRPPAGYAPSGAPQSGGFGRHLAPGHIQTPSIQTAHYPSSTNVMSMQQALIKLANDVIAETATAGLQANPSQSGVSPAQTQALGRTSFADFITMHYTAKSDVKAVEFDPNAKKTQMSQKDPSEAKRMNTVMDTMKRVGSHGKEFRVDGKWGPRTNAALHNAYALAFALLQISKDFGFVPSQYNMGNLGLLKPMIPEDETQVDEGEKGVAAKEIATHINAIDKMFGEVKQHILQNPGYQSYIEGDQPFATYKKEAAATLTPQQIQTMKQSFASGFTVPLDQQNTKSAPFSVDDLLSLDTLNRAIARTENQYKVKLDPYNTLTMISDQLGRQVRSI